VSALKRLNQPLLFQRRKIPLPGQPDGFREKDKCFAKTPQTLVPSDVKVVKHKVTVADDATGGSFKFGRHILPHPSRREELGRLAPRETFTSTR